MKFLIYLTINAGFVAMFVLVPFEDFMPTSIELRKTYSLRCDIAAVVLSFIPPIVYFVSRYELKS